VLCAIILYAKASVSHTTGEQEKSSLWEARRFVLICVCFLAGLGVAAGVILYAPLAAGSGSSGSSTTNTPAADHGDTQAADSRLRQMVLGTGGALPYAETHPLPGSGMLRLKVTKRLPNIKYPFVSVLKDGQHRGVYVFTVVPRIERNDTSCEAAQRGVAGGRTTMTSARRDLPSNNASACRTYTRFAIGLRHYTHNFVLKREAVLIDDPKRSFAVWRAEREQRTSGGPARASSLTIFLRSYSLSQHTLVSTFATAEVEISQKLRLAGPVTAITYDRAMPDHAARLGGWLFYPPTAQARLSSLFAKDPERPHDFWGRYLFAFRINDKEVRPTFDAHVDYRTDKGHAIHWVAPISNGRFRVVLSVRRVEAYTNGTGMYRLFQAITSNFISFSTTRPLQVSNQLTSSRWYCYPHLFEVNGRLLAILNQDDFGKKKPALLASVQTIS
jgi:hypothetical protein